MKATEIHVTETIDKTSKAGGLENNEHFRKTKSLLTKMKAKHYSMLINFVRYLRLNGVTGDFMKHLFMYDFLWF